jgi:hypothetical protein
VSTDALIPPVNSPSINRRTTAATSFITAPGLLPPAPSYLASVARLVPALLGQPRTKILNWKFQLRFGVRKRIEEFLPLERLHR